MRAAAALSVDLSFASELVRTNCGDRRTRRKVQVDAVGRGPCRAEAEQRITTIAPLGAAGMPGCGRASAPRVASTVKAIAMLAARGQSEGVRTELVHFMSGTPQDGLMRGSTDITV